MAENGSRRSGGSGSSAQQLQNARPKKERKEWSRGPRSLFLRRCDNNGFGFTLRHFIVYPPESYTVLQGDRRLGLRHGSGAKDSGSTALDEPMDTIFVKNVRENSSAHAAGLATGDRIISVNGETITGRTYAQVVQLIQQSGNFLHLLVVPKEDDILQLYFGETAHNPETNQRPSRIKSPETLAHHRRSMEQASMLRQQSPPFSSQTSSLPHHLHHHRQHLTSQNQAKSLSLLQNSPYLSNLQGANTASFPQTDNTAVPSTSAWSPQSLPASGNESHSRNVDRVTYYYGARGQDANSELPNFHSHLKGPTVRRNSEGSSPTMNRESAYGYTGSGRDGGDFRGVGGGNESNLYYSVPGKERRVSADNSIWSKGSTSTALYKLRQSEDIVGSAGGGLTYPSIEGSRGLINGQNLGTLGQLSDSSTTGSSENVHSNSLQRLQYSGTAGCRLSLDAGTTRRDSSVSLPSNGLVRDYTTSEGSKDSLVSYDSASTITGGGQDHCSSDDSLIMSRIRKSFEQKEEFLKRPNQPISWNMTSGNQQPPSIPLSSQHAIIAREFYARPQKFQRPLWPPQNSASSSSLLYRQQSPPRGTSSTCLTTSNKPTHQNLQRVKSDIDCERESFSSRNSSEERPCHERALSEPWDSQKSDIRGEFMYGGPVSNVPTTAVNKSTFSQHTNSQFRPITPISVNSNMPNSSSGSQRHGSGSKSSFVSTLTRIHENIPVSDLGGPSSGNYASSNFSDSAEVFDTRGGPSSLPLSLPSSTPAGVSASELEMQQSHSLSSANEESVQHNAHPVLQLVSRRARQFETGKLDEEEGLPSDRTSLYRSELSRLSSKRSVPNVAVRKKEFESRSISAGSGAKEGRRLNRESRSLESAELPSSEKRNEANEPIKLRARSNSAESWAAVMGSMSQKGLIRNTLEWPTSREDESGDVANEPQRHKAVRQDSYLAAVRTPVTAERMTRLLSQPAELPKDESEEIEKPILLVPKPLTPAVRPNQLPIANPLRPAIPQPTTSSPTYGIEDLAAFDTQDGIRRFLAALSDISPVPVSTLPSDSSNVVTLPTPDTSGVVRRQKNPTISEEERLVRRVSYLKATWGDRMHVDSDLDLSDLESPLLQHRSAYRKWRPPLFPDDIQRLKRLFEEAAAPSPQSTPPPARQRQRSISGTQTAVVESLQPESNKENLNVLREGWLHCKITLVDGKRAGDRSWKQVWAVLRGPTLCFYKERRDSQQQQQTPLNVGDTLSEQQQSTSSAVDVRCSQVDIAGDYTKKKHVLRLNTFTGSELLLQAEDAGDMVQWLRALQDQSAVAEKEDCSTSGSSKQQHSQPAGAGGNSRLSPLPAHKGIRKLTSFRNRSPTGQSPVNKTRKPSQTDQIPSPKTKTWKGRVAKQLRRIQPGAGSPSSPTAPHPEGVTIGIPLEDCPQSSFSEFVPLLVELCTNIVELRGLDIIGIYRVPGNTAAVSSLTEGVNKGFDSINLQDPRWNDVNVISSLLKLFFRRLPDALLTSELYPLFIEADKIEDAGKRMITVKKLLHDLPEHHFETLKFLLFHLKKVVEHSAMNKMEARNLAIVFGPTLVRTADDNMVTMVTDMSHQCRIVESLISHVDWFFSDDDSDEFGNFPFSFLQDSSELEPASTNHNLLLSNIQKVEGMRADSPNKDISAKDIVSSIISAANRKMQKAKSRKGGGGGGSGATTEDGKDAPGDIRENMDVKEQTLDNKSPKCKELGATVEGDDPPASNVANSIFESVVFSGNIVKSIHTGEEEDPTLANSSSICDGSGGGEMHTEVRSDKLENVSQNEQLQQKYPLHRDGVIVAGDEGTIRTYAGLSATTQERIRRFERETKAMLQRDLRQRHETERREAEKRRIEMELQQAKRDMENEDLLDEIADNPSGITRKISDMNSVFGCHDKKSDSLRLTSSVGQRLPSSTLLSSCITNSSPSLFPKSEPLSLPTSESDFMISSASHESRQVRVETTKNPASKGQSSEQKFTQTKKVGTTHFFPGNLKNSKGSGNTHSSSDVMATAAGDSSSTLSARTGMECINSELERGSWSRSAVATTNPALPPSGLLHQETRHMLHHGSSAENLLALSQHGTQKGAHPPNGTLKKLKTGKEQLELAPTLLSSQPSSPLIGSLRCSSLDSLEACGSERPQSDISDDGSDLLASLTSTFDRKLKSLLSATPTTVEAVIDPTETKPINLVQETDKPLQKKETEEDSLSPVSPSQSMKKESVSPETSATVGLASVQPAATLFRDPSLHRRKNASVEHQKENDFVKKEEGEKEREQQSPAKVQDNVTVRGRSRDCSSFSNRRSCPQKSDSNKNCGKKHDNNGNCVENIKKVTNARPKSTDSVTRLEKTDLLGSTRLRRSESLTKSEKEEGTKLKRSESLTKPDKNEATVVNTRLKRSESLTKAERTNEVFLSSSKLKRSESLSKAERTETSPNTRLRRSESLTKAERSESPSNSKLKRSDSLTKTEKTESNISKRRQQELLLSGTVVRGSGRGNKEKENIAAIVTKLKRKNGMPERSIKRRHTVGGTKDFDKLHWLDNRLQHEQLAENEAANVLSAATMNNKERRCLRTSSPDLSSSRLSGILARDGFLVEFNLLGSEGIVAELRQHLSPVTGRPHSLPDPNLASRVFKVPLESHV